MRESQFSLTFENLVCNVRDAIIDWEEPFTYNTVPEILAGIESGRLNKDDYEVNYHIMGGVYDPSIRDYRMLKLF